MKGSEFVKILEGASRSQRMALVYNAVLDGYAMKWPLSRVPLGPNSADHLLVADDYFAIGEPDDFVRVPLDAPTAQRIADHRGFLLPTQRIVQLTWAAATVKLAPRAKPSTGPMLSVQYFVEHNATIESQRQGRTGLIAGIKKDVVVTNRLLSQPGRVPICGWTGLDGKDIQPLSLIHEASYADYSHGVRFVCPVVYIGGTGIPLEQALADEAHASRLSTDADRSRQILDDGKPVVVNGVIQYVVDSIMRVTRLAYAGDLARMKVISVPSPVPVPTMAHPPSTPPASLAPSPKEKPSPITGDIPGVKLIQAPKCTRVTGTPRKIDLVVFHTAENPEKPTGAEATAAYFASLTKPSDPNASAHFSVDCDSIVQSVLEKDVAWAAPGANNNGIQIEHAGYARQTRDEWSDAFTAAMLDISAKLTAGICQRHGIPVKWVDAEGLLVGERGITSHAEVSKACRLANEHRLTSSPFFNSKNNGATAKTNHSDPGAGFDASAYVALVRQYFEVDVDPYA